MSCFATVWVPSGEPSSTMMTSQSSLLAGNQSVSLIERAIGRSVLVSEHPLQEPYYDGQVLALVESGEEDGVFVAG